MAITGLNHVGLSTPDIDRANAFYRDGLGFSEIISFAWPVGTPGADAGLGLTDTAASVTVLLTGNSYLEVLQFDNPRPIAFDSPPTLRREGISHIGLEVTDLANATDLVVASGGSVDASSPATNNSRLVRDPDGNIIELHTSSPDDPLDYRQLRVHTPGGLDGEPQPFTPARRDVVKGLSFVGITTARTADLTDFYKHANLNPSSTSSWESSAGAPRAALATAESGTSTPVNVGNAYLDFIEFRDQAIALKPTDARIIEYGFNHLCFDVVGIDSTHQALTQAGMTCFAPWINMPGGTSAMGYALDVSRNPVELLEHLSARSIMWPGHLSV
jgi:catechol 2,3-dioxygenase-like lactoylglutathione lyase family enzyme